MLNLEHVHVIGFEPAVRGMRNPMNSWDKSDSFFCQIGNCELCKYDKTCPGWYSADPFYIGDSDMSLMKTLIKAGTDHRKFMRMLTIYVDIEAPLYWWKEFDTYKVGTVANSCSTMHKIHSRDLTIDDFSIEDLDNHLDSEVMVDCSPFKDKSNVHSPAGVMMCTISMINLLRKWYIETGDKKYWRQMIQMLPSSYNQKRTVMLNYEVLSNMYKSRKDHKLKEWHQFLRLIDKVPYGRELIIAE